MKILVTGGVGFIGSHLVDELVRQHEVVILDNISTGQRAWLNEKAKFIEGDVRDESIIEEAMAGCRTVFHLAAQTDVRLSQTDPDLDYEINFVGAKNVFNVSRKEGCHVVFPSSAAVYGNEPSPHTEDSTLEPVSQYGWNKLQAERISPPNAFIPRLFNVYGPRGKGAINLFIDSLAEDKPVTIRGTGLQTRDWIYIDDVVSALLLGLSFKGIYNIGTGKETTVLATLHLVEKMLGKKAKTEFVPGMKEEVARSFADITKLKHDHGWAPRVSLQEGIRRIVDAL